MCRLSVASGGDATSIETAMGGAGTGGAGRPPAQLPAPSSDTTPSASARRIGPPQPRHGLRCLYTSNTTTDGEAAYIISITLAIVSRSYFLKNNPVGSNLFPAHFF